MSKIIPFKYGGLKIDVCAACPFFEYDVDVGLRSINVGLTGVNFRHRCKASVGLYVAMFDIPKECPLLDEKENVKG